MIHFYQFTIIIATNAYQPKLENIPYSDMFITHGRITMILKICMALPFFFLEMQIQVIGKCVINVREKDLNEPTIVVDVSSACSGWTTTVLGEFTSVMASTENRLRFLSLPLQKIILFYFYIKFCKI